MFCIRGVTNNLSRRISEHKSKINDSFTAKYNVDRIIWYEAFENPYDAISAEKRIKGWKRCRKLALIKEINPGFEDLLAEDPSQAQDDIKNETSIRKDS